MRYLSQPAILVASFALAMASCASRSQPMPVSEPQTIAAPVPVAAPPAAEEDEDEITGKSLYVRHCAGCHNDNGDGRGATMLQQGKEARSFAQGGFAFGNTPDAIFKTITSGIPGSSLMQPFKGVMDDDERMLVANYVLTLTPYKAEVKAADSVMIVGDRAVFAYGKLPPIQEGLPERPRGLMVGLPGGLSFEYRVDDVRLLAVRRGGFVDREDWNERGGGFLKPLGEIVFESNRGDPGPQFSVLDGSLKDIELELVSTQATEGGSARLELRPRPGSPPAFKRVVETLFAPHFSSGTVFGRRIEIERPDPFLILRVAAMPRDQIVRGISTHIGGGQGDVVSIVLKHGDHFACVLAKYPAYLGFSGEDELLTLSWQDADSNASWQVTIVVADLKDWNEAIVAQLAKELAQ